MSKRRFELHLECVADIELDDAVINAVDADWRSSLYDLHTPEEIARHVGYNLIVNGLHLSSMDGWADQDNSLVRVLGPTNWTTEAIEHDANGTQKEKR
jgi:hypothetical protein